MGLFSDDYDYNSGFASPTYVTDKDVIYQFESTSNYSYIDVSIHSNWAGNFNPGIAVHVITGCPEGDFTTISGGSATGTLDAAFVDGYLYAPSTYYVVVSQRYTYAATYDLEVNLWEQTDFKSFETGIANASTEIDYTNHTITVTVPQGTDVSTLNPTFVLPRFTEVYIDQVKQLSGQSNVDFSSSVNYSVVPTIGKQINQQWAVTVNEDVVNNIKEFESDKLVLSPNPVTDLLTIQIPDGTSFEMEVSVYNSIGSKVLISEVVNSESITLSMSQLEKGVCFIMVESNGQRFIQKVLKM